MFRVRARRPCPGPGTVATIWRLGAGARGTGCRGGARWTFSASLTLGEYYNNYYMRKLLLREKNAITT